MSYSVWITRAPSKHQHRNRNPRLSTTSETQVQLKPPRHRLNYHPHNLTLAQTYLNLAATLYLAIWTCLTIITSAPPMPPAGLIRIWRRNKISTHGSSLSLRHSLASREKGLSNITRFSVAICCGLCFSLPCNRISMAIRYFRWNK